MKKRKFPKNSVCKPCGELKYCPYGHMVEHFPIYHKNVEDQQFDTTEIYQLTVDEINTKSHFIVGDNMTMHDD